MLKKKYKLLSISDAALESGLINFKTKKPATYTLRFWEKEFKQLNPTILSGGRRYYSQKDIEVIRIIFFLLKVKRLTINGAKKALNEKPKQLDVTKTTSIKGDYYKKKILNKSKNILNKLKKLNG